MAGIVACNPGDILQAMENKLVADAVVPTADPIYWLMNAQEIEGNPTGKHDILFRCVRRPVKNPAQIGGGRIGLQFELFIEVRLRTIMLLDRIGTDKDQLIDHWNQEDAIISSFHRFFPSDTGNAATGNLLTIEGLLWYDGEVPAQDMELKGWGGSFGIWKCTYLPRLVTYTPLG